MLFEQVLPALRKGKRARRTSWKDGYSIRVDSGGWPYSDEGGVSRQWSFADIWSDDWEIVAEPLTDEQLIAAWEKAAKSERETFSKSYGSDYEAARRADVFALCARQLRERKL